MALDERFDPHLAQAENLTTLFVAVHDGVSKTDPPIGCVVRVSSNGRVESIYIVTHLVLNSRTFVLGGRG